MTAFRVRIEVDILQHNGEPVEGLSRMAWSHTHDGDDNPAFRPAHLAKALTGAYAEAMAGIGLKAGERA